MSVIGHVQCLLIVCDADIAAVVTVVTLHWIPVRR